jgi:hypothetical protein
VVSVCLEWLFDRIIDLELNTDIVLPEIVNVLNCVGKDIGYTESIRNLIEEEASESGGDDSVDGVVGDTSRDESMVSTDSGSVFDEYYAEQKKAFITALWEWALRKSCIMQ